MKRTAIPAIALPLVLVLSGCAGSPMPVPTATVSKTAEPSPTATVTPTPTPAPIVEQAPAYSSIDDPNSITVVVNKHRPLTPANFESADMSVPTALTNNYGRPLRTEAAAALDRLATDASATGIYLSVASAYRSYDTQVATYNNFVARDGQAVADTYSARPGHSEHQTGLAVDLDDGSGCLVEICFADTVAGQWLAANAWQYGFILRYPNGATGITGYQFEPWHYRYVGTAVSIAMHNQGTGTLEEYFGLEAAPSYY